MSYKNWFENHARKHKQIVDRLVASKQTREQIIEYFTYENMAEKEGDFCPLYIEGRKCHDMDELNCYLCACPNFRFNDDGIKIIDDKMQYSFCSIDSKDAKQSIYGDKIHQNCTACVVPHIKTYIEKHFDHDWKVMMNECCFRC